MGDHAATINQKITIMSKIIYFRDADDYNRQVDALYEEWNRVEWIQRIGENKAELFCSM